MKKMISWVLFVVLGILTVFTDTKPALAAVKEKELFTLTEAQDVTVTVTYEYNDAVVELISPSGQIITKDTDTDNITVLSGQTGMIFFLGGAEAGRWEIRYDKGSNESISVSADVQDMNFFITEFTMDKISDEGIPVEFLVSGKERTKYQYKISVTTDKEDLSGKELASGQAYTGTSTQLTVPLQSLSTYDEYYLLLYVSYSLNGSEVFDFQFIEKPFSYVSTSAPAALTGADITIEYDWKKIILDWENFIPYRAQSVYVQVKKGENVVISRQYLPSEGYATEFSFDEGDIFSVNLTYKDRYGRISEEWTKTIYTAEEKILLPDSARIYSENWAITYQNADNLAVEITVNGNKKKMVLNGSGNEFVTLPQERNEILVRYIDKEEMVHSYRKNANVTLVIPEIELLRSIDGVTTQKESILISGTTNAETLTINNEDIALEEGMFIYSCPLAQGDNFVVMEASIGDNVTRMTAFVSRNAEDKGLFNALLYGLGISAVGIILVVFLSWLQGKMKWKEIIPLVVSWLLVAVIWAVYAMSNAYINGAGYLDIAFESISEAAKILERNELLSKLAIGLTLVVIFATLICIVVRVILVRKEKNAEVKGEGAKDSAGGFES